LFERTVVSPCLQQKGHEFRVGRGVAERAGEWLSPAIMAMVAGPGWLSCQPGVTSMPLTWALSLTVTNWMVIAPLLPAVAVKDSAMALYSPPAVA
jgi:hypothetical protein